jgi:hypothetical protein
LYKDIQANDVPRTGAEFFGEKMAVDAGMKLQSA